MLSNTRKSAAGSSAARRPLVVWGASGHAKVIADIVALRGIHYVEAFVDDVFYVTEQEVNGIPVIRSKDELLALRQKGVEDLLVGVGENHTRKRLVGIALRLGFSLPIAIHPSAVVARDVSIGRGTVVMAQAVISAGTRIGCNVVVNTGATVDHDCDIADFATVGPGANIGGHCTIADLATVGIGAAVRDRCSIGDGAVIGAGAAVVNDIPPNVVAVGVPAKRFLVSQPGTS